MSAACSSHGFDKLFLTLPSVPVGAISPYAEMVARVVRGVAVALAFGAGLQAAFGFALRAAFSAGGGRLLKYWHGSSSTAKRRFIRVVCARLDRCFCFGEVA